VGRDHKDAGLPVYLPAFYPGVELRKGDRIEARIEGALAENGVNRDYRIAGRVVRGGRGGRGEEVVVTRFDFESWHYRRVYRGSAFYERLFRDDTIRVANHAVTKEALAAALGRALPEHMVPTAFVTLPALPRTASGKLDRRALPAPEPRGDDETRAMVAPRTGLEEQIAGIWRAVLDVREVGVEDNFFKMGGESLQGLRVLNRLRDLLGESIPLSIIFEAPTIAGLAGVLERSYGSKVDGTGVQGNGAEGDGYKQIPRIPRQRVRPGAPRG